MMKKNFSIITLIILIVIGFVSAKTNIKKLLKHYDSQISNTKSMLKTHDPLSKFYGQPEQIHISFGCKLIYMFFIIPFNILTA